MLLLTVYLTESTNHSRVTFPQETQVVLMHLLPFPLWHLQLALRFLSCLSPRYRQTKKQQNWRSGKSQVHLNKTNLTLQGKSRNCVSDRLTCSDWNNSSRRTGHKVQQSVSQEECLITPVCSDMCVSLCVCESDATVLKTFVHHEDFLSDFSDSV